MWFLVIFEAFIDILSTIVVELRRILIFWEFWEIKIYSCNWSQGDLFSFVDIVCTFKTVGDYFCSLFFGLIYYVVEIIHYTLFKILNSLSWLQPMVFLVSVFNIRFCLLKLLCNAFLPSLLLSSSYFAFVEVLNFILNNWY